MRSLTCILVEGSIPVERVFRRLFQSEVTPKARRASAAPPNDLRS
jgi:hypothetical protein